MAVSPITTPTISPLQPAQQPQQNKTSPAATPPEQIVPTPGSQIRGSFLDIKI